jgi:hypothetical protein
VIDSITYEADGQTDIVAYANGVRTNFRYDLDRRWLSQIDTDKGGTQLRLFDLYAR